MKLVIKRVYSEKGTNGALFCCQKLLCYTIELPWRNNEKMVSCIPEGTYKIDFRFSEKFGNHLEVKNVINRSLILIHPANNALKELKGCIAPVSKITGEGLGISSRKAMLKLMNEVKKHSSKNVKLELTIKKENYEIS
jgi:hypothetical protein